jgi:hypothetical protein
MDFKEIPEYRKGQAIFNFLEWIRVKKDWKSGLQSDRMFDPFALSDDTFDALYDEYLDECFKENWN